MIPLMEEVIKPEAGKEKVIVVDHQDSFTFNLVHLLERHFLVTVISYSDLEEDLIDDSVEWIVFSPGPGTPQEYEKSLALYQKYKGIKSILGICLGFQLILCAEGANLLKLDKPCHGKRAKLTYNMNSVAYAGLNDELKVGRYHSLFIESEGISSRFSLTSFIEGEDVPMSFECVEEKIFGFQYHPDSFLTEMGSRIFENIFLNEVAI